MTNHTEKPQDEAEKKMKRTIEEIKQIPYEDLVELYFMAQSEVFDTRNIMQGVRQQAIDLTLELEHIKSHDVIIGEGGCLHLDCSNECQKDKLTFSEPEGELVKIECDNNECIRGANYLKNQPLYHAHRLKSCEVPVVSKLQRYDLGTDQIADAGHDINAVLIESPTGSVVKYADVLPTMQRLREENEYYSKQLLEQDDHNTALLSENSKLQQDNKQLRDEVIDKLRSLELLSNKFPSLSPVLELRKEIAALIDKLTNGK